MESDYNSDLYRQSSFHGEWKESKLVGLKVEWEATLEKVHYLKRMQLCHTWKVEW